MYKTVITLFIIILTGACHKALHDINEYFPQANTIAATVRPDGSVLVEGEIISEGAAPVGYFGFCCATQPQPELLDRQMLAEYVDGKLSAVYTGFDPDSVYYFRSWAANEYGYTYGNVISLDNIVADPVTAPCTLVLNSCNIGGGEPTAEYHTVSAPSPSVGYWEISAATSTGPTVYFKFGSAVMTGVYRTVNHDSPSSGDVFVSFYDGSISGKLNAGSDVYVNTVAPNTYEIYICDAPWIFNGSTNFLYFNTRLKSPL